MQELKHYGVKGMKWGKRRARTANDIKKQHQRNTKHIMKKHNIKQSDIDNANKLIQKYKNKSIAEIAAEQKRSSLKTNNLLSSNAISQQQIRDQQNMFNQQHNTAVQLHTNPAMSPMGHIQTYGHGGMF